MNATTTTEITLELDGETASGHVLDARGAKRTFSGWIGLMGVLDSLLDEARDASTTRSEN